jgi:hypothetical protein
LIKNKETKINNKTWHSKQIKESYSI